MPTDTKWSYGYGVDIIGGLSTDIDYSRYNPTDEEWYTHKLGTPPLWIQQLYGEIKYRSLSLSVGLKQNQSALVDDKLSSGDVTFSANARPIPGFKIGLIDYRNIPFTKGWMQLQVVLSFAKATDNGWVKKFFDHYYGHYNNGWWYNYKRVYFRTNPAKRLSVTFGMQAAAQFGGTTYRYRYGELSEVSKNSTSLSTFLGMIIPQHGDLFYKGNHTGSWDLKARYIIDDNNSISPYFQWIWEDGSGIGKLNGWDGLWGIEYRRATPGIINAVVLEYIDFTNQSGPLHWDPEDVPHPTLPGEATGYDNYYNNEFFNGYALYGMSIGTPFNPSPFYNRSGDNEFRCTRVRGMHLGLSGHLGEHTEYRAIMSYCKGWGTYTKPFLSPKSRYSVMLECRHDIRKIHGLSVKCQLALDSGELYGNNFGALASFTYRTNLNTTKKWKEPLY